MCAPKMLSQSTQNGIIVTRSSFVDLMRSYIELDKTRDLYSLELLQHSCCGTHFFCLHCYMGLFITDYIYILRAWRLLRQPLLFLQEPLVL